MLLVGRFEFLQSSLERETCGRGRESGGDGYLEDDGGLRVGHILTVKASESACKPKTSTRHHAVRTVRD